MNQSRELIVVMYHYIRDYSCTEFPRLNGIDIKEFKHQIDQLIARYEMASIESALSFLKGEYSPQRHLCLLTFDDGLIDHYHYAAPILREKGIEGLFFITTSNLSDKKVLNVHKNHFLLADYGIQIYQQKFIKQLSQFGIKFRHETDTKLIRRVYRWDNLETATFKYLINYVIPSSVKNKVLSEMFFQTFGDEQEFALSLYLQWEEAREMQHNKMVLGGHSHHHEPLAELNDDDQFDDLNTCYQLLTDNIAYQPILPFCYPFGKNISFNSITISSLKSLGFSCGFASEVGNNRTGMNPYKIRRIDPKDISTMKI
jgi:hypothetical protein